MINGGLLSVGDFAKITRTTSQTLHHYDRLGLLSPVYRGNNKYRYYSMKQLALCNTIRLLQKLGVSLAYINEVKDHRTPKMALEILARQIEELDNNARKLNYARKLLHTMQKSIQSGVDADIKNITIQALPAENIMLGDQNDYSGGKTDYDALIAFYQVMNRKCSNAEYDMLYPVWGVYSAERICNRDWNNPDRYYFYNPSGQDQRPAALYAVGYKCAGYGQSGELYSRMIEYIDQNGFEICGNTYEEYPHNEICITDDSNYLLRVLITVREKIGANAFDTRK